MPNPKEYKDEQSFVSACIPIVLKEGTAKDNKQASAICYSMWKESKKSEVAKAINNFLSVAKARTSEGYESPEPGKDLPEEKKKVLARVYAECRKKNTDKEKCAKIAWGAVKKSLLYTHKEAGEKVFKTIDNLIDCDCNK